jgi:dTDP-4-amino-4,6-dideoxygalactose transaminase
MDNKCKTIIPFVLPEITKNDINAVVDVLKSGWITTGQITKKFEEHLSRFCKTNKTVCVNSATAAMELTLRFLGIGPGDEVITSAYTYTASASVIEHVGAKIVLVDVDKGSYHISAENILNAVTDRTKAVIAVDIAGVPCCYDRLFSVLEQKKHLYRPAKGVQSLFDRPVLIADAAHAFGSLYKDQQVGNIADFTCFSFHAVKNLTTGEGGAITWRPVPGMPDDCIYKQFMLLSMHGQNKDALEKTLNGCWEYDINLMGYKCNMPDIMAALGLSQLWRYSEMLFKRHWIIDKYDQAFQDLNIEILRHKTKDYVSNGHLYMARLTGADYKFRNYVIGKMLENSIMTNVHYKPLPMHSAYKKAGFDIGDFPNAYEMYKNEISLPLYTLLTDEEAEYVADSLKGILGQSKFNVDQKGHDFKFDIAQMG